MSWPLAWTEEQTLNTSIPSIELACEGSRKQLGEVLQAAFGSGDGGAADPGKPTNAAELQNAFSQLAG